MAWVDSGGKVLIQWATATVSDWVEYTFTSMSDVRAVPKKPEPSDSPVIDNNLGWIAAVNIQGVVLTGDHIGFSLDGQGRLVVGLWNDDPADWPCPWGLLYTFDSCAPDLQLPVDAEFAAANPGICGQVNGNWYIINTRQTVVPHADAACLNTNYALDPVENAWMQRLAAEPALQSWASFPENVGGGFGKNNTIHGVWLDDTLWQQMNAARSTRGWEEWRDV
jgi:hypothetical protein